MVSQAAGSGAVSSGGRAEESSTVVVGAAPDLGEVLNGEAEHPFDRESFTEYARRNLFVESLEFLVEADKLDQVYDAQKFTEELQRVVAVYIAQQSPCQVNLSSGTRQATERAVRSVVDGVQQDPSAPLNRGVLDEAKKAIFSLVRSDQYPRYVDFVVVQRQLLVACEVAQWWKQGKEGLTLAKFFTFPSPVNSAETRLHNLLLGLLTIIASALTYFMNFPWLWLYIVYGFVVRALCGPRLDPQAFFVLFVLRPIVADKLGWLKNSFTAGSPKRFAQGVGCMFSLTCTMLAFLEYYTAMVVVAVALLIAVCLAGFFDICLACYVYLALVHFNMVPSFICEDCRVNYVSGKPTSCPECPSSPKKDEKWTAQSSIDAKSSHV